MLKQRWLWLGVSALLLSSAFSCSGSKKGAKTIGFAQEGDENDWRTAETKSVQSEAERRGMNLKLSNAQGDLQKQVNAVRSFITQRVDAIVLAPKVESGWEPVLQEAKNAKIPVILVDRGVSASPDLYTTLIASDFVEEGRRAAEWLAKHTVDDPQWKEDHGDGKLDIVELEGSAGAAPAIDRKKGFDEEIQKHPGMNIVASQDANFTLEKGKEVMTDQLNRLGGAKNIQAVYAHNDNMALGAVQAISAAGAKPGSDVMIVSIDGIHPALEAVLKGQINCVVECNPLLGPDALDAAEAAIAGKPLEKRKVEHDALFDHSNLTQELLNDRKY